MKEGQIVKVIKRCYYFESSHCTTENIINLLGRVEGEVLRGGYGIDVIFDMMLDDVYILSEKLYPTSGLWMKEECVTPATDREAFLFYTHGARALKDD